MRRLLGKGVVPRMTLMLSPEAETQLREVVQEKGHPYVRLAAFPACGCGRVGYSMGLEDGPAEADEVVQVGSFQFVVDAESREYVEGAKIGFSDDMVRGGFTIESPNAQGCSCGGH